VFHPAVLGNAINQRTAQGTPSMSRHAPVQQLDSLCHALGLLQARDGQRQRYTLFWITCNVFFDFSIKSITGENSGGYMRANYFVMHTPEFSHDYNQETKNNQETNILSIYPL
jgi:hypothetical protein